jgi:hypothetical protein
MIFRLIFMVSSHLKSMCQRWALYIFINK